MSALWWTTTGFFAVAFVVVMVRERGLRRRLAGACLAAALVASVYVALSPPQQRGGAAVTGRIELVSYALPATVAAPSGGCADRGHFGANAWSWTFTFNQCLGADLLTYIGVGAAFSAVIVVASKVSGVIGSMIAFAITAVAALVTLQIHHCDGTRDPDVAIIGNWWSPSLLKLQCRATL